MDKEKAAEKKAEKKAAKEAKNAQKQANKVEIAKAKNPEPIAYGDSSSVIGSGDDSSGTVGGIPWLWVGIAAVGLFVAFKYFRR